MFFKCGHCLHQRLKAVVKFMACRRKVWTVKLGTHSFNLTRCTLNGFLIQQSYIALFQRDLPMGVLSTILFVV